MLPFPYSRVEPLDCVQIVFEFIDRLAHVDKTLVRFLDLGERIDKGIVENIQNGIGGWYTTCLQAFVVFLQKMSGEHQ